MPVITIRDGKLPREGEPGLRNEMEALQTYNCLDATLTASLYDVLKQKLAEADGRKAQTYDFERALLAPCMLMGLRGIPVNQADAEALQVRLEADIAALEARWEALCVAQLGRAVNHRSRPQMFALFHDDPAGLRLPRQEKFDHKKGVQKQTLDEDALLKLRGFVAARPFVDCLLELGPAEKQLQFVSKIVQSGRMHGRLFASFKPYGTTTLRFSSGGDNLSRGGAEGSIKFNAQNVPKPLRRCFGIGGLWECGEIDLEGAESYGVAYLARSESYMKLLRTYDVHAFVTRSLYPDLGPWDGTKKTDKAIADQKIPGSVHSYRDVSKRVTHGSSYRQGLQGVCKTLGVDMKTAERFQTAFFTAVPELRPWQQSVREQLQRTGRLVNPFGLVREFTGRLTDESTVREAVAHLPQSFIAMYMNTALLELARRESELRIELWAQIHDAAWFAFRKAERDDVLPRIAAIVSWRFPGERATANLRDGRVWPDLTIPVDIRCGSNLAPCETGKKGGGYFADDNPYGLQGWSGGH